MDDGSNGIQATVKYGPNKLEIIGDGWFVKCAVTGENIYIEDLRYWNVNRQEAYKDASTMWKRELELREK